MVDRDMKKTARRLCLNLTLALLAIANAGTAATEEPGTDRPHISARRMAARALERRSSTQWPSDVAERLRILEEHGARTATPNDEAPDAANPLLLPPERFR
jgi:hypothetical protein